MTKLMIMQNIVNVIYDMLFKKSFEIYKHIKKRYLPSLRSFFLTNIYQDKHFMQHAYSIRK